MIFVALAIVGRAHLQATAYGQFVDRITKANSVSGIQVFKGKDMAGYPATFEQRFWLKRPNLCRVEIWNGDSLESLWVGDGKNAWWWHPKERRLDLTKDYPGFDAHVNLFSPFYGGEDARWIEGSEPPAAADLKGRSVLRSRLKEERGDGEMVLDMDPKSNLPIRFAFLSKDAEAQKSLNFLEFKDLKVDPVIAPSTFKYVPEVAPNSWNPYDYMLKVGDKAPNFSGKLLAGKGRYQLATALKQHKAILLDFMVACAPCWKQLRTDLADLHQQLSPKGLSVVAVGIGSEKQVNGYLGAASVPMPVVIGDTCHQDLLTTYKVAISATQYLVDSNGIIRARYSSADMSTLKQDLAKLGISD